MGRSAFYFGASERRLFGIYEAPQKGKRGVVLCNPWGNEYLYAHQSMRYLADLLAEAGLHVLRFDWFGTGDSAGDAPDPNADGWLEDLDWAIDELRDVAGIKKVALLGLRSGAAPAIAAACARKEVDRLVLWDPVIEDVSAATKKCPRTLVITHCDRAPGAVPPRLAELAIEHTLQSYQGPQAWEETGDFGASGMPVRALQAMTEWLS